MSCFAPRPAQYATTSLSPAAAARLRSMLAAEGVVKTLDFLGCSTTTLDALRFGGKVRPDTIARIEGRLLACPQG